MRKPFCIQENKGAHRLRSECEADRPLCFRYTDSTIPLTFSASSNLLCSVYVRPVWKSPCWFSHEAAQMSPFNPGNQLLNQNHEKIGFLHMEKKRCGSASH